MNPKPPANDVINRRTFLQATASGLAAASVGAAQATVPAADVEPVRIGVIGCGNRGRGLLAILLGMKGVEIPALCDIDPQNLARAHDLAVKAGQAEPAGYADGPMAYKSLLARDDLNAVIVATPWDLHAPMALDAMRAGKAVGCEVPIAQTVQECWDLVNTHEETGVPCMMLENWSFRRDNLAVLNMIRKGLLGEIMHGHCAYSHDCTGYFWDAQGQPRWPARFLKEHNRDLYPTHSLGPMLSWMDINCGDAFATVTSTATAARGANAYFARKYGPDHPDAKRRFTQGDVVTTVVRTHRGRTIVINNDMQLPRPYDNRWLIQGTLGIYSHEHNAVYLEGRSPKSHQWEPFEPYQDEFDHAWWKAMSDSAGRRSHGGTDHLEMQQFIDAVPRHGPTPIDIYDSVTMSVIVPLSGLSIARGSAPVECPDFTRGRWAGRKPTFALEV